MVSKVSSVEIPGPPSLKSIDNNPKPPSMRSVTKEIKSDKTSAAREKGVTATKSSGKPAAPEKEKRGSKKVVYTNGFFSFVSVKNNVQKDMGNPANDQKSATNSSSSHSRSSLDRIMEICYLKSDTSEIEVSSDEKAKDDPVGQETKNGKKKKKKDKNKKDLTSTKKKQKKSNKADETEETKETKTQSPIEVDTKDTNSNTEMKETTKGALPAQVATDAGKSGTENPQIAAQPTTTAPKKKKKKKKKKKDREVIRRDAAGRIIRKRRKNRNGGKVVHPDCFKKGKDVKIGLSTIDEGFYEGLENSDSDSDDFNSRGTYSDDDDDDDMWDDDVPSPPDSSGDEDSSDEDGNEEVRDRCANVQKIESNVGEYPNGEPAEKKSFFQRLFTNKTKRTSLTDEVDPTNEQQPESPTDLALNTPNNSNDTIPSNEIVRDLSEPITPSASNDSQDPESPSEESLDSTCCTSTASVQNSRDEGKLWCCCRSRWAMFCSGLLFVVTVAGGTVALGYLFVFSNIFGGDGTGFTQQIAPSIAPSAAPRPNLRPSQQPPTSPTTSSPPPNPILDTILTSCYLPKNNQGTITIEAEYATEIKGFSSISNKNTGYCGEGYVSVMDDLGSGFEFSSFEVQTTGYYSVSLRYSNADKSTKSMDLRINGRNQGTFDLKFTGDASAWSVDTINYVLLRKGETAIRISMLGFDQTRGPSADWLTMVLQQPLSEFDYLSGLIAQASSVTAQTLLQTSTLQWMANEDPFDYSDLTDAQIIDRYALLQIYASTAGDMWRNKRLWLSELHACAWYGITCSEDFLVTKLTLGTFFRILFTAKQTIRKFRMNYSPFFLSL